MDTVSSYEIAELRLGKKVEEQFAEAEKLYKQVTPHSYGPPPIRFEEEDVDQARAAGVLIEFERGRPLIVDRSLYRELAKRAVKRTVEDLRVRAADVAAQRLRLASLRRVRTRILWIRPSASATSGSGRWATRRMASISTSVRACSRACRASILRASMWRGSSSYADVRIGRTGPTLSLCRHDAQVVGGGGLLELTRVSRVGIVIRGSRGRPAGRHRACSAPV